MTVKGARCFDVWSADSRELAAEVLDAGIQRILVVDVATGDARFLTEPNLAAGARSGPRTGARSRSRTLGGAAFAASGSWAPMAPASTISVAAWKDGRRRERTAGRRTGSGSTSMRQAAPATADLSCQRRRSVQPAVDGPSLSAYAPALSPDGTKMSFIVERGGTFDLYAAGADGGRSPPRPVERDQRRLVGGQ